MKWNREEITKELIDNCPDNASVAMCFVNPKTFKKLFNKSEKWHMEFLAEGNKRVVIHENEAVIESYIIASYSNPDYRECIAVGDEHIIFPQTGVFTIPLVPEDE